MSNSNITQRGTQDSDLGVMIGRCSLDCQHERPDRHPANAGCSLLRYTNVDLRNHTNRDLNGKHGLWKTTNLHYTAILGVTPHKEDTGKE